MKVIHIIPELNYGGAEKFVTELLPFLKFKGVDVSIISIKDEIPLAASLKNIPIYTCGHQGSMRRLDQLWKTIKKVKKILKNEKPDIIHSHLYAGDIFAKLTSSLECKLIATIHGADPRWNKKNEMNLSIKVWLLLEKLRKPYYIAVSNYVKSKLHKVLSIPESKIFQVYNGINLAKFKFKDIEEKTFVPTIVQIGRLAEEKGHIISIMAFRIVKQYFPKARLLFVGNGYYRNIIANEVKKFKLDDSIYFLGERDDVYKILEDAHVLWMPSFREGLPLSVLEAMACGLPVIASNTGGLPEVVFDEKTGYLIDIGAFEQLAEKTIKILSDKNLAKSMGLEGRKKVEEFFSIEKTADNYLNIYKKVLSTQK